jgi:hypothetical protein
MNKTNYISLAIGLLLGLTIAFAFRSCGEKEVQTEPIVIHDTIKVQDSAWLAAHTKHNPKPIRHDTIWIEREDSADNAHTTTDSNHFVDTTKMVDTNADYALVPITQSEYRDTFLTDTSRTEVGVLFSGYNARIDSIGINYQLTRDNRVERKKSGFGWVVAPSIQVGYGLGLNGNIVTASPYVGIGVSIGWGYHW